jgi:hypothetical protein
LWKGLPSQPLEKRTQRYILVIYVHTFVGECQVLSSSETKQFIQVETPNASTPNTPSNNTRSNLKSSKDKIQKAVSSNDAIPPNTPKFEESEFVFPKKRIQQMLAFQPNFSQGI